VSQYEQALIAAGIPPEQAARDSWANDVMRWANREHPMYGNKEQDDDDR
jgi:hypothetical protein